MRRFDARLAELGAKRLDSVVECDLDYEDTATAWTDTILAKLPDLLSTGTAMPRLHAVKTATRYDKYRPYPAEVLVSQKITGSTSSKDVRHIELSPEGSGVRYEPGDSLAVIADNPPQLVAQFLDVLGYPADQTVVVFDESTTITEALSSKLEITAPSLGLLKSWAGFSAADELRSLLEPAYQAELSEFVGSHQIIDIIRKFPAMVDAAAFANSLRKLSPRSYSIASSQSANPDEVHLTVAAVRYGAFGSDHWGSASTHLADRLETGYLFPETYRFIDDLTDRLTLKLQVFQSEQSSAWQEARYGKRWENGVVGLDAYNHDNKVRPMERALESLNVGTWFAGLRRSQSKGRAATPIIASSGERWKVHPIADWSDRDVYQYLTRHDMPYHPLWEQGYISIGDSHTTHSLADVTSRDETRFGGIKRECGLHEMDFGKTA